MPLSQDKLSSALKRTEIQSASAVRKECASCHVDFDTFKKWEKRCEFCRDADAPYTKRVYNQTEKPF